MYSTLTNSKPLAHATSCAHPSDQRQPLQKLAGAYVEMQASQPSFPSRRNSGALNIASPLRPRRTAQPQRSTQPLQPIRRYLETLRLYAALLGVNKASADLAGALARGRGDLLVVLLEPLEYFKPTTLEEAIAASHTLREIDRWLKQSSGGERNLTNTVVLDVRVFLSARQRETTAAQEMIERDERSFAVFQKMVHELDPKVIITCQCGTVNARNSFVRQMSSTFPPSPDRKHIQIRGRQVPLYRGCHPGVYKAGHIEKWAGPNTKKQAQCREILTSLLGLIFRRAFQALSNVHVVGSQERTLRDQLQRLLCCGNGSLPVRPCQQSSAEVLTIGFGSGHLVGHMFTLHFKSFSRKLQL